MKLIALSLTIALAASVAQAKPTEGECIAQSKIVERIAEFRDRKVQISLTKKALPTPWWGIAEEVYKNTDISPTQYKQRVLLRCLDAQMA